MPPTPSSSSTTSTRPARPSTPDSTSPANCSPTSASSTKQLKASHRRIRIAVAASNTSVTDIYGIGPIIACYLIGYTGDISRFANRDAYAAYNGTAPVERSSGGRVVHRVSQRGNRKLNHALHLAAICQIRNPGTEGRIYFEGKVAEGKTKKDAIRSLKRHISNAVYRQLVTDAARAN
jgi:transposase